MYLVSGIQNLKLKSYLYSSYRRLTMIENAIGRIRIFMPFYINQIPKTQYNHWLGDFLELLEMKSGTELK